jgi:hypothetical protein
VREETFTVESGLLTANGKLRRDRIATKLQTEIEGMYSKTPISRGQESGVSA